ncbi:MAG: hypothetical protein ACE3L7_13625 [Candidatus Pristimantibacillus sp.]
MFKNYNINQLILPLDLEVIESVQIASEGQFTLAYGVFPNPTDTKTLIPFLIK